MNCVQSQSLFDRLTIESDLKNMWDEVIEALLRSLQAWAAAKEQAIESRKKQEECNDWYAEESSLNAMVDNEYSEEWQWEYT
tara:strand:- start:376 stop:621 length:246 start_codon:yes stop_codon:yes gene_type:complete